MKDTSKPEPAPERWTVDALEDTPTGRVARLERPDGRTFDLPLSALPEGLKEGDLLDVQDGPDGMIAHILPEETQALKQARQADLDALNSAALATNENGEINL